MFLNVWRIFSCTSASGSSVSHYSPHDLHEQSSPSVNSDLEFFSFIAAIRSSIIQTDSEQTDFACDDDSTATEVCPRCCFLLNVLVKWMFNVSHVLSLTHYSRTLRTTLTWGHRYWETSLRRFDGLVRVYFELVRAERPANLLRLIQDHPSALTVCHHHVFASVFLLVNAYQKRLRCGFRCWKRFLFSSSFSSIVS